ncbi:MAG: hypothetical protein JNM94_09100 [Phycisphaerae bacterium]|nr:hypothetical protein [Phycisphaerae bacterium]
MLNFIRCSLHRPLVSSLLAAPLVLTGLALVGTGVAGSSEANGPGSVTRSLRDVSSLVVEATVQFVSVDPRTHDTARADGFPTLGFFSYTSVDNAWHVRSYLDSDRFVGMNTEVAFDGTQRLVSRSGDNQFSVTDAGEPRSIGMALPNPLFALASWAMPVNDTNLDRAVKLSDLRSLTDAQLSIPASAWTRRVVDTVDCEVATVRGDVVYGIPYHHELVVAAGQRDRLLRIDRVSDDGVVLSRAEFDNWEPVDGAKANTSLAAQATETTLRLPRVVRLSEYRPMDGMLLHTITFQLNMLAVNGPVNDRQLWVDQAQAKLVYNADLGEFEELR